MKLKTFKIWLYLLPVVAIIGVLLFVQSANNREELVQQHIRSIESLSKDVQMALSDYIVRCEVYILRKGFAELKGTEYDALGQDAEKIMEFLKGFNPKVIQLRYYRSDSIPGETVFLEKGNVAIRNRKVYFRREMNSLFQRAVQNKGWITGSAKDSTDVLVMDLDVPISELLRKVETHDFTFANFFLTNSTGLIVYPEQSIGTQIFTPITSETDTVENFKTGISLHSIQYNQRNYQAYSQALMLGDVKLYFLGIYEDTYFQKVALRIDYNLLSSLLFILIVLVCSIPILAVVNMGKGDILSQSRIIQVGVSLMALAVVVGFTLSFVKNAPHPKTILGAEIKKANQEFSDSIAQYNSLLELWKDQNPTPNLFLTNELITVDSLGFVRQIYYYRHNPMQKFMVNFENGPSFTDLKQRAYVNYFDRKIHKSSFISSHYSRGSGLLESVISSKENLFQSNVYAVTYTHHVSSTLTDNFRILLVKEDGTLIFKSNKVESSYSNLNESISSEKWTEIGSLLKNNDRLPASQSLETTLYLNGHQYHAHFSRLDKISFDQPLWSVFLINVNVFNVFSALTSLEGILFILAYFLFLLFTLVIQQFVRKSEDNQGFKAFLFDWLVPSDQHKGGLVLLNTTYFFQFILLLLILFTRSLNHIDTLLIFTVSALLISYFNLFQAKIEELKKNKIHNEIVVNVALVLVMALISILFNSELLLPMILLIGFGIGVSWLMHKGSWWSKWELIRLSNHDHLSLHLLIWFFMIGFLPGYLIHSKTQQFEQVIWSQNQTPASELTTNSSLYEKKRRAFMSSLSDPFDQKIQNFIYPDQRVVEAAWEGSKLNTGSSLMLFLLFGGLLLLSLALIKWVQRAIFFEFKPHFPTVPEHFSGLNFICCLSAHQIPKPINPSKTNTLDFVFQSIPQDFPIIEEDYIFYNIHCLKDLLPISQLIAEIKAIGGTVTVYSGSLWKNLYQALITENEKVIFSEIFSDFRFMVIEIDEMEVNYLPVEEEMLSKMKRRKAFYANIWTELSFEEKQVCYSYAKEGFFNFAAKDILLDLAQKGIIVPNSTKKTKLGLKEWHFFSPVFRQYILASLTEEELVNFKKYEKKNGNIHTIQTAVISFVLICIALVGIFDQTFFNEAYAYLTGGLGLLGTLYSFLNQGFAGLRSAKKEG